MGAVAMQQLQVQGILGRFTLLQLTQMGLDARSIRLGDQVHQRLPVKLGLRVETGQYREGGIGTGDDTFLNLCDGVRRAGHEIAVPRLEVGQLHTQTPNFLSVAVILQFAQADAFQMRQRPIVLNADAVAGAQLKRMHGLLPGRLLGQHEYRNVGGDLGAQGQHPAKWCIGQALRT